MKSAPILIIDKEGLIGEPLSLKLSKEFPVVYVGNSSSAHISFSKRFPTIPDHKYSHIVVIGKEGESLNYLPKIIEKAKGVNSNFIFAQELSHSGKYLVDEVLSMYSSSKIVLYGDIFETNRFLFQAQRFQRIQLSGDGLVKTYPVFIQDVADGLIDLIFGINNKHSLFYLFPKHPITELFLAHAIQKANPEIGVDFIPSGSKRGSVSYPSGGKYLLEEKYPIAQKIRNIDIKKNPQPSGKIGGRKKLQKRYDIKRFSMLVAWILIFLILSPLVFTLFFSFLGLSTLYFAKSQIDKGNFDAVKRSLHLSQTFFCAGKKTSDILYLQLNFIGRENNLRRLKEDISFGYRISEGALQMFNSADYFSKVFTGKSKNPRDDITKGESYLKNSVVVFEKIKAEGKMPLPLLRELESIAPLIKLLSNTSDILPGIFGMEMPKTYLILFQNNMELRPGGGLIDSYGILKFNMGRITEFSINDVDDADRQLRGHVEPPFAIRRYLPSVHWYMRDSNFDVDFVKSASASSNFLSVETGQEASGTIGIDMTFVKNILSAIGPVYLENYKQTAGENNLYKLMQSQQEEKFLGSLFQAMLGKISKENIHFLLLAKALSDSLSQKHLVFAFNDNTQNIFTANGWSSSLWDERKDDEKSVNDFLGINESNLGINNANYFIRRQVLQKVIIEDNGNISEELTINYKNENEAVPGEDYKNYLRVILPENTKLSKISIDDVSQSIVDAITNPLVYEAKNFRAPIGLEVEKDVLENKTVYGFLVNVPAGKLMKIKIKYTLAKKINWDLDAFSYNLRLFKQPGIDSLPYSFSLTIPTTFKILNFSGGLNKEDGRVAYSQKITKDETLIIDFAKK